MCSIKERNLESLQKKIMSEVKIAAFYTEQCMIPTGGIEVPQGA